MGNGVGRFHLRPEARPVGFDKLDSEQQRAYERILESIIEALPPAESSGAQTPRGRQQDRLQEDRSSRLVFLSGARGTGKTTVLLSLRKHIEEQRRAADRYEILDDRAWAGSVQPFTSALARAAQRVVWLEPLDMEPISESTNLLAAILTRIEDAMQDFGRSLKRGEGGNKRNVGLFDPAADYLQGLLALQQLQSDVALAWDGNLPARAGHLDPDVYAIEVMRSEKARINLNHRFTKALEEIAGDLSISSGIQSPLFLLPVDDFDINPLACLPLLRLLRMISVPRLFSIVLGDVTTATTMLNLKVSGDLARVISAGGGEHRGGYPDPSMLSVLPSYVGNVAGEIAFNALRKLVPPAQRIQLEPLDAVAALKFVPFNGPESETLKTLLEKVPVEFRIFTRPLPTPATSNELASNSDSMHVAGKSIKNLYGFLTFPKIEVITEKKGRESGITTYAGIKIVHGSLRRASDLWLRLFRIMAGSECETFMSFIADFCEEALAEDSALAAVDRQSLPLAIGAGPAQFADFSLLPITMLAETYDERRLTSWAVSFGRTADKGGAPATQASSEASGERREPTELWAHLSVRKHRSFTFRVAAGDAGRQWAAGLREHTAAALTLYHDLLVLTGEQASAGESPFSPRWYLDSLVNTPTKPRVGGEGAVAGQAAAVASPSAAASGRGEAGTIGVWRSGAGAQHPPGQPWAFAALRVGRVSEPVRISWPLPAWRTFWEFNIFLEVWDDAVELASSKTYKQTEKRPLEWLSYIWISAATAILTGRAPEQISTSYYEKGKIAKKYWSHTFDNIGLSLAENNRQTPRGRRFRDWAARLALFTLPEFGLPYEQREFLVALADEHRFRLDNKEERACLLDIWNEDRYFLREQRGEIRDVFLRRFPEFSQMFDNSSNEPALRVPQKIWSLLTDEESAASKPPEGEQDVPPPTGDTPQ